MTPTNSDTDLTAMKLHGTTDASVWTNEFDRIYPDSRPDWATMFGWFANAIEVGRMFGVRETLTPTPDPLREAAQRLVDVIFAMAADEPFVLPLRGMRAANDVRAALAQSAPLDVARLQRIEAAAEALIWDLDHGHPTTAILRAEQRLRAALAEPQRLFASTNLLTE